MQITIHRGTHEIGGSCVEVRTDSTRLIIDVGLPLVDENREPFDKSRLRGKSLPQLVEEKIAPAVPGLFTDGELPDGILLSHAHLDHVGLLSYTPESISVYATSGTSKMMKAGAVFAGQTELPRDRYREIKSRVRFTIGDISVTPYSVDHSCFGAVALLLEAGGQKLLYSGDLRCHGRKPGMIKSLIDDVAPTRIDALVMEGTHFGSEKPARRTEFDLEAKIVNHINAATGLVLSSFSPIDVDRLVTYFKAATLSGREFVVDAYTAFVMYLVHTEISMPDPRKAEGLRILYNQSFKRRNITKLQKLFANKQIAMDEILASPSNYLMCFRPSMLRLDFDGQLPPSTTCLYSYWSGYLTRPEWIRTQTHLQKTNGYFKTAHTSGHIYVEDLVKFVRAIRPKVIIPIHTFEPESFSDVFENCHQLSDAESLFIAQ